MTHTLHQPMQPAAFAPDQHQRIVSASQAISYVFVAAPQKVLEQVA